MNLHKLGINSGNKIDTKFVSMKFTKTKSD